MRWPQTGLAFARCIALLVLASVAGCANWKAPPSLKDALDQVSAETSESHLANTRRLMLDVEFVNLPSLAAQEDPLAHAWQWVDETSLDPALRSRLLANGLRAGLVSDVSQFLQHLEDVSSKADVLDTFLDQAAIASDTARGKKQIPMRYGRRYELPVRKPSEGEHVALLHLEGETVGRTLNQAQYLLAMTARKSPTAQQVRLHLRPEVQYGETRQKFVSSDTALRIDTRRESWSIEPLGMDLTLQEGDTVALAPTSPLKGLAKQMLSSPGPDQQPERTVVLIRVSRVPTAVDQL